MKERAERKDFAVARNREFGEMVNRRLGEALTSKGMKEFLQFRRAFRRYSFYNQFFLSAQAKEREKEISVVNSFKRWKELGGNVKTGEKAFYVFAPVFCPRNELTNEEEEQEKVIFYIAVPVFDLSQVDGVTVPEIPDMEAPEVKGIEAIWDRLYERIGAEVKVNIYDEANGHNGWTDGVGIHIYRRENLADMTETLIHEYAHYILHQGDVSKTRIDREIEAELTVFIVMLELGIDCPDTFNYMAFYAGQENEEPAGKELTEHLENAFRVFDLIFQDKKVEEKKE